MSGVAQLLLGIAGIIIGVALVWYGMPDRKGQRPRFLQGETMEMIYPVIVLAFFVIGGTSVLTAFF
jgi:hypothetical protein